MDYYLILALAAYVTGAVGFFGHLLAGNTAWHRIGHAFFLGGLVCQTLVIFSELAGTGFLPVGTLRDSLAFAAWALALVYAALDLRYRVMVLGAAVAPIAAGTLMAALFLPVEPAARPDLLKSAWTFFHVLPVFVGDAAFLLAALVGAAYLVQERAIKKKRRGFSFNRMPPLDTLDRLGYACVVLGFAFLTVGLVSGFVYAKSAWGRWWSGDPKEVWSLVTWLLYAALLHERLAVGWRGRRAALLAICGAAVILFTFLGLNLLLLGHHGQFAG